MSGEKSPKEQSEKEREVIRKHNESRAAEFQKIRGRVMGTDKVLPPPPYSPFDPTPAR